MCGLVFADPTVYRMDPAALYTAEYFRGEEYADYLRDRGTAEMNFRALIRRMRRWSRGGRLFEIGCAYGFFLNLCRDRWTAEGVDVSSEAVRYARATLNLQAGCGDFLDMDLPPDAYDAFCLWDTIEHLARPDRYVEKVARCLRPGGVLFLTTGDIGSLVARWRGSRWRLIHPPTHLFYFSRVTLRRLLGRYGMEVMEMGPQGYCRSLDSMLAGIALQQPEGFLRRALRRLAGVRPLRVPFYLNLRDILFVAARKSIRG